MTSRLTINLDALAANFHTLRAEAAGAQVCPVVKADGYGLGATAVSRRLWEEGARSFFVARLEEGERLRASLGTCEAVIHVLDGAPAGSEARLIAASLSPVLCSVEQAQGWRGPRSGLHVDTGMNRLGVSGDQALDLAKTGFRPSLVMSHLGRGDAPDHARNRQQLSDFRRVRAAFTDAPASFAASAGIYLGPDFRFEAVRPGISLYGGGPRETPDSRFRAVATLDAPVLQLRDLKAGEAVGYGTMFTALQAMRIAVIGAGYADGVIRRSHRAAHAFIGGTLARVVVVTMDLIAIDVSEVPRVKVGDTAELLGPHALLDDLAKASGSVAHECLVHLSQRAQRHYQQA